MDFLKALVNMSFLRGGQLQFFCKPGQHRFIFESWSTSIYVHGKYRNVCR